ncbi:spermidine synthase [Oxobacter pfennigii]|uniref:Polyamine aminopropyltransferase n=1 Tax=Oxobacter pfennigii TaxID=36849 RepID=A0A0P8WXM6_9CLOT|nr:polyamine aminopropyltransferase [Oxobacter pfennigii]KPU43103.1 spermidine synthase [Oxobacter pfennigii]
MEMWIKEMQIEGAAMTYKVNETLLRKKTEFQDLAIVDTPSFGRMLVLDGIVQTTIKDEFIYHEMITHIPLFTHPNPKKVLVVGGGDGGAIREILKHPSVEKAVLCEIDGDVIEACKKYLPEISCALDDKRCEVFVGDGIKYVKDHKNEFDVIIVDSTDPFNMAEGLFGGNFYRDIFDALTEEGIFIAQTETPYFLPDTVNKVFNDAKKIFPVTKMFMAGIPTYPGGYWSFTVGSKKHDPSKVDTSKIKIQDMKYYTPELHNACFVLPQYVKDVIGEK